MARRNSRTPFRLEVAVALVAAWVLLIPSDALAGSEQAGARRPVETEVAAGARISVLTFGPGTHPFSKFGHDAIRVRSGPGRRDLVYNFGTFRFDSPWLIVDFLRGRFKYWLSVEPYTKTVARYRALDRSITEQDLLLTAGEARKLARSLAVNALPERREYLYDYYRDNCATRVRDALDDVLDGALRAQMAERTGSTYRDHTLGLTRDRLGLFLGLDLALNDVTDRPITEWEEAFLPAKLAASLRDVTVSRAGRRAPLVSREVVIFKGGIDAPSGPRPPLLAFGLAGLGLGIGIAGLGALARRRGPAIRAAAWLFVAIIGTLGIFGCLLVLLWTTNHDVAQANENILQFAPWTVAAPLLVCSAARRGERPASWFRGLFVSAALTSALGGLLKLLPTFDQENVRFIILMLPIWIGAAAASHWLARSRRTSDR